MFKNGPFRFFHSFRSIRGRGWSGWGVLFEVTWLFHQHQILSGEKAEEDEEDLFRPTGHQWGFLLTPFSFHTLLISHLGENLYDLRLTANFP